MHVCVVPEYSIHQRSPFSLTTSVDCSAIYLSVAQRNFVANHLLPAPVIDAKSSAKVQKTAAPAVKSAPSDPRDSDDEDAPIATVAMDDDEIVAADDEVLPAPGAINAAETPRKKGRCLLVCRRYASWVGLTSSSLRRWFSPSEESSLHRRASVLARGRVCLHGQDCRSQRQKGSVSWLYHCVPLQVTCH